MTPRRYIFSICLMSLTTLLSSSMYYKDFMGVTYGPFDDKKVREWWNAGYLNDYVLVTRDLDRGFLPIRDCFPEHEAKPIQQKVQDTFGRFIRQDEIRFPRRLETVKIINTAKSYGSSFQNMLSEASTALYKGFRRGPTPSSVDFRDTTSTNGAPVELLDDSISGESAEMSSHKTTDTTEWDNCPNISTKNETFPEEIESSDSVDISPLPPIEKESDFVSHPLSLGRVQFTGDDTIRVNSIESSAVTNSWSSQPKSSDFSEMTRDKIGKSSSLFRGSLLRKVHSRKSDRHSSSKHPPEFSRASNNAPVIQDLRKLVSFASSSPQTAVLVLAMAGTLIIRTGVVFGALVFAVGWLASLDLSILASPRFSQRNSASGRDTSVAIMLFWRYVLNAVNQFRVGDFSLLKTTVTSVGDGLKAMPSSMLDLASLLRAIRSQGFVIKESLPPTLRQALLFVVMVNSLDYLVIPALLGEVKKQIVRRKILLMKKGESASRADLIASSAVETHHVAISVKLFSSLMSAGVSALLTVILFGSSQSVVGLSFSTLLMMLYKTFRCYSDMNRNGHLMESDENESNTAWQNIVSLGEEMRDRDWSNVEGGASLHLAMQHKWDQSWAILNKKLENTLATLYDSLGLQTLWRSFGVGLGLMLWTVHQLASLTTSVDMTSFSLDLPCSVAFPLWPRLQLQWKSALNLYLSLALLQTLSLFRYFAHIDSVQNMRMLWRDVTAMRDQHGTVSNLSDLDINEDEGWSVDGPDPMGGVVLDGVTGLWGGQLRVKNVSVHFPAGKITAIIGEVGSGKTSLLQTLLPSHKSIVSLQRGQVWVRGRLSTEWNQKYLRSRLAVLNQREPVFSVWAGAMAGFFDPRTVEERVLLKRACAASGVQSIMEKFPDGPSQVLLPKTISQLGVSEESLRRFALCRILLNSADKDILLLDEPALGMSEQEEDALLIFLRDFIRRDQVVVLTSSRAEIARKCDHAIILDRGAVVNS